MERAGGSCVGRSIQVVVAVAAAAGGAVVAGEVVAELPIAGCTVAVSVSIAVGTAVAACMLQPPFVVAAAVTDCTVATDNVALGTVAEADEIVAVDCNIDAAPTGLSYKAGCLAAAADNTDAVVAAAVQLGVVVVVRSVVAYCVAVPGRAARNARASLCDESVSAVVGPPPRAAAALQSLRSILRTKISKCLPKCSYRVHLHATTQHWRVKFFAPRINISYVPLYSC